ncbi:hypothetical protein Tco_0674734 [Tanacetum coccineum]
MTLWNSLHSKESLPIRSIFPVSNQVFKVEAKFRHVHQGIGATWAQDLDYEIDLNNRRFGVLGASGLAGAFLSFVTSEEFGTGGRDAVFSRNKFESISVNLPFGIAGLDELLEIVLTICMRILNGEKPGGQNLIGHR